MFPEGLLYLYLIKHVEKIHDNSDPNTLDVGTKFSSVKSTMQCKKLGKPSKSSYKKRSYMNCLEQRS